MFRLAAHFDVDLPGQPLIAWPDDKPLAFACTIKGFRVSIILIPNTHFRMQRKDDHNWTRVLRGVQVRVCRDEVEHPPEVKPNEAGKMDYSIQFEYFQRRQEEFGAAAQEAVNRVLRFFRFSLMTPYLEDLPASHQCFSNARWTDEHNRTVGKGGFMFVADRIHGSHGELGVLRLTPDLADSLQRSLEAPSSPSLFAEVLSDAQTSWFAGNLRRCVLELALACEILVKRSFFAHKSPAGAAFDWLEDKGGIRVRVVDLLDGASREAFGHSFREEHREQYCGIDQLFRCRNKVAHRGELSYRDDKGTTVRVDAPIVAAWFDAVRALSNWFASEAHEPDDA